jgi:hypothetical protein
LVQAHYEARANRFGGALGSARDLYERDDPTIERGEGRARGRLDLARNQVILMKGADASTFIHETGHNWLEEFQRDSQHEKAPPDLIADMDAVRSWLGAEEVRSPERSMRNLRAALSDTSWRVLHPQTDLLPYLTSSRIG